MKKNGFTLIELLAVIIILAVVALIATPIVLNVVDDAKKSAAESEANMIVSGIQNGCATKMMQAQMDGATEAVKTLANACDTNGAGSLTAAQVDELVNLGNATLDSDPVTLTNGKVTAITITSNDHTLTMVGNALSFSN